MPARPVPFCLSAPVRAKKGRMESANRGRRAGTPSQVQGPRTGPATRFASHPVPVHTIHGRNGMAKTDGRRSAGRGGVRRPFAAGPLWLVHQQLAAVSAWHGIQRVPRGDEKEVAAEQDVRAPARPEPCNGTACCWPRKQPERDKRNERSCWGRGRPDAVARTPPARVPPV